MAISKELKNTIVATFFNQYDISDIQKVENELKFHKQLQNEHDNFEEDDEINKQLNELKSMKDYLQWQEETAGF